MDALDNDIAAFEKMRERLEAQHLGKWVVFHQEEFIGTFDSFHDAAQVAVKKFGAGPYLIRQIGARPQSLPASVLYRPIDA
ncbi:MAG: hypothetical protein OXL41_01510 [Nitrospinae bacterium]|nr:hypothetical protein [Nitrospinota bacterium]MDE0330522.1 hypothetical protein [Nitrospinota bacterium]